MKQSKLIAPAFAAAMLLTGCGGRNHNDNVGNDMNRVDDTPTATAAPQPQENNSIRRSNESEMDDIARNSERVRDNNNRNNDNNRVRDNDNLNNDNDRIRDGVGEAVSDIAEGGRRLASDVVSDAKDAVNDVVDGREDNDGTYRADKNGNVNN